MANMQNGHYLSLNRKQNAIAMLRAAIEQLTHFIRESFVFRGKCASSRDFG